MPDTLKSNVRLFADDTISALTDCHTLQSDLPYKLEKWEEEWLMSFNPDKCEIIHISRKQKTIIFQYTLHIQVLKSPSKAKYLGVTITNDLTSNHHINNITNKAHASLRFIKRNVKTNSIKTKELAYKTYVRPKVEYCSVVCRYPWQKQQINKIEMIQRRAARYTLNQYSYQSSVNAMLQHLCWPTLQQRRNLASVTMLCKLQHQLVSISNLHYLVPSRDHKFIQPFSPTNYHLYSFFPRTIRLWNSLPNQVADSLVRDSQQAEKCRRTAEESRTTNSPDLDAFNYGAKSFLYC